MTMMTPKREPLAVILPGCNGTVSHGVSTPSRGTMVRRTSPNAQKSSVRPLMIEGTPAKTRRRRRRPVHKKDKLFKVIWTATWVLVALGCVSKIMFSNFKYPTLSLKNRMLRQKNSTSSLLEERTKTDWQFGEVVHVVQTRLMQSQPDLIDLGFARLQIFKHFCLPTMQNQTSQEFLWIIRTDPNLDPRLKEPLLQMVEAYPHYVVVASNHNPEGFRHEYAIEFTREQVWSGSYDLSRDFHEAAQTRIVLESRLDADDGLHTGFVENLQRESIKFLQPIQNAAIPTWMMFCAFSHMEWQPSSPWTSDEDSEQGYLIAIKRRDCITPGLTAGYGLNASRHDLPAGQHAKLHKAIPSCTDTIRTNCLMRFGKMYPGAVRARTPTSAGMNGVLIRKHGNRKLYKNSVGQLKLQNKMWAGLKRSFAITRKDTTAIKSHLLRHLVEIAKDNLKGQCTKGHSCKTKSQLLLKKIIESASPPLQDDSPKEIL